MPMVRTVSRKHFEEVLWIWMTEPAGPRRIVWMGKQRRLNEESYEVPVQMSMAPPKGSLRKFVLLSRQGMQVDVGESVIADLGGVLDDGVT